MQGRFISWNVNGIRSCARKGFFDWLRIARADLIALQEVRAEREDLPLELAALRRFLTRDHAAERREQEARLSTIVAALEGIPGVEPELLDDRRAPRPYPTLIVRIYETIVEQSVEQIVNALADGDQPICVSQNFLHEDALGISPTTLRPGEEAVIAERLRGLLMG